MKEGIIAFMFIVVFFVVTIGTMVAPSVERVAEAVATDIEHETASEIIMMSRKTPEETARNNTGRTTGFLYGIIIMIMLVSTGFVILNGPKFMRESRATMKVLGLGAKKKGGRGRKKGVAGVIPQMLHARRQPRISRGQQPQQQQEQYQQEPYQEQYHPQQEYQRGGR